MTLRNIQKSFKESILEEHDDVAKYLTEPEQGIGNKDRIHIYRNNTFVSLKQVLVDTFAAVTELASIEFMRYVGHEFIKQHPPKNGALMFYGKEFPNFLKHFEAAKQHPYLADVADLEWALNETYDAADSTPLTAEDFTESNLEKLMGEKLRLTASTRVLSSAYPIFDLWSVTKEETQPKIDLTKAQNVLIYRDPVTLHSMAMPLDTVEYTFLSLFTDSCILQSALEKTLQTHKNIDLEGLFVKIISNGLLERDTDGKKM